jgi:hypothetical protein
LRTGLMLTAEQERYWPAFEQAVRELQQRRLDRFSKMGEGRREGQAAPADPVERLRQRGSQMSDNGAALRRLADAMDPLYRSLNDGQKRRFGMLARMGGMRGMWGREHGGREDREHRGGREDGEHRGGREQGMPGRRSDASPNAQPAERTFSRNAVATEPVQFGSKLSPAEANSLGGKSFGAKSFAASSFAAKSSAVRLQDSVSFRGKVTVGEPTGFGGKAVRQI